MNLTTHRFEIYVLNNWLHGSPAAVLQQAVIRLRLQGSSGKLVSVGGGVDEELTRNKVTLKGYLEKGGKDGIRMRTNTFLFV
jgi:hypothetical protein